MNCNIIEIFDINWPKYKIPNYKNIESIRNKVAIAKDSRH